jgi:hypothetical protein
MTMTSETRQQRAGGILFVTTTHGPMSDRHVLPREYEDQAQGSFFNDED